jgi:two-component system, chemotaxis family, protein-glutamate methylesterase/glutaminase
VRTPQGIVTRITEDPPENSCRPAVDYLFRSLRDIYGAATVAMMMTGMGEDGLRGCRELRAAGAFLIAQDAASCTVYGMPRGPIEAGIVDVVAPLSQLADRLIDAVGARVPCN